MTDVKAHQNFRVIQLLAYAAFSIAAIWLLGSLGSWMRWHSGESAGNAVSAVVLFLLTVLIWVLWSGVTVRECIRNAVCSFVLAGLFMAAAIVADPMWPLGQARARLGELELAADALRRSNEPEAEVDRRYERLEGLYRMETARDTYHEEYAVVSLGYGGMGLSTVFWCLVIMFGSLGVNAVLRARSGSQPLSNLD